MDVAALFQELNRSDEHQRLEAKTSVQVGNSLLETICAFANEPGLDGGFVLLGVQRVDSRQAGAPRYEAVGLDDPDKLASDLATRCADAFNRPIRPTITAGSIDGRPVLAVYVPESPPGHKPIFFAKRNLPGGAYRRLGSTDQRCTEDDLEVLYEARRGQTFDATVCTGASMADLDPAAIQLYRRERGAVNPDASELTWSDEELLEALGAISRAEDGFRPTMAGIVLFGSQRALRRLLPTLRVDYVRVPGRVWVPDPSARFSSQEFRGPAIALVRQVIFTVLDDMPRAFRLAEGAVQRQELPLIPANVVREAIANAIMHRSYRSTMPLMVIRYANRLEIINPGFSLKNPDQLGLPGSVPRNPLVAAVLHEAGLAEAKGSGVRAMRLSMQDAGLSLPTFESDRGADKFTARFLFHHFLDRDDLTWLGRFADLQLSSDECKALIFVREVGAIDNATYRDLNAVDTIEAGQHLRRLRERGLLDQHGQGAATYYRPTAKLLEDAPGASVTAQSLGGPPGGAGEPQHLPTTPSPEPQHLPTTPPVLPQHPPGASAASRIPTWRAEAPATAGGRSTVARNEMVAALPPAVAAMLTELPARAPREAMRDLIKTLCAWADLRADEMEVLLGRNRNYLLREHLTPMVASEALQYLYPQMINHPDQAYRTA
ncbi:MAG: putative transcriptional regulator [Cyanobacteria bacterium RYN_339]|nr:putative transcriptional regulator [Cyanobacteria bacterium RYN_339]